MRIPKKLVAVLPAKRVIEAYQAVFSGRGSNQDADLVKADLEDFSGFFSVTEPSATAEQVKYSEGRRSVYGRIHLILGLNPAAIDAVESVKQQKETDE